MGIPRVVLLLLLTNTAIFFTQPYFPNLTFQLALWPLGGPFAVSTGQEIFEIRFEVWQIATYSFLHGGLLHLFSNMLAILMFGTQLERLWGSKFFAKFYFVSVATAAATQLIITSFSVTLGLGSPGATLGASGGVFGILLAFGLLYPNEKIFLLLPPIPIKAKLFVVLYGLFELYAGLTGTFSGIAHFAHLGGMIGGFIMLQQWKGSSGHPHAMK